MMVMLALAAPAGVAAQDPELIPVGIPTMVDRVVAIVGNQPILNSHVEEALFQRQQEGLTLPTDPAGRQQLRAEVIEELISTELLVREAQRDSTIVVTDEEVASAVQKTLASIRRQFSSELEFEEELKKAGFQTPQEFRRYRMEQQRRTLLQNRLIETMEQQGRITAVQPTEQEMRAFFDARIGQVSGERPATIAFQQIVIQPEPSQAAKDAALATADSVLLLLRGGADFAELAKAVSDDPGSAENGGGLGWFRRGVMTPEFEQVAFAQRPGVISDPVESPFGFHLIQVERTQPAEVQARHILIRPLVTETEAAEAESLADEIYAALLDGAPFDSLQRLHHNPSDFEKTPEISVTELTPPYSDLFAEADSGDVIPPFRLPAPGGNSLNDKFVVAEITLRRAEGKVTYDDVQENIRQSLGREMSVQQYLDELRSGTYVKILAP
jgi:peptidyl-prolyl cis-trans isomerase SurA